MRLLGFEISRAKVVEDVSIVKALPASLQSVSSQRSSWWWNWPNRILESFPGAWQRNIEIDPETSLLAFSAVFACVTGIASDIAKMRIKLSRDDGTGIWEEITSQSPWLPVLRKPNHYQTRIKFVEQWIVSKLLHGNTYVLKQRNDKRDIVTALYILDPTRVRVLVAEDGSVFYRVSVDHLSGVEEEITIPASEIIHDMMVSLWHPLVGVSPIYACGVSATMGNRIQANSTNLFANGSRPGGVVMFPGAITNEEALEFKTLWELNFGGANAGRTAVLDNGSKFEAFTMPAQDAQLIEQLRWTVEDVARAFHYPMHKLGGPMPTYNSIEAVNMGYYTDCLQSPMESMELCLDEGLELPAGTGTEFDLDNLMRMDTNALYQSNTAAKDWMKVDEMRARANLKPIFGGDTVYRQQQDFSIAAIARRDAQENPFATAAPPKPETPPSDPPPTKGMSLDEIEHGATAGMQKAFA